MKKQPKFRIVTDDFAGYEVQIKKWWFPFWVQCWRFGIVNSFGSIERAEQWVKEGRPKIEKFNSKVVKLIKTDL